MLYEARASSHPQRLGFMTHIRLFPITFRKTRAPSLCRLRLQRRERYRLHAASQRAHRGTSAERNCSASHPSGERSGHCVACATSGLLRSTLPQCSAHQQHKIRRACSFRFAPSAPSPASIHGWHPVTFKNSCSDQSQQIKKIAKVAPGPFLVKVLRPDGFAR